MPDLKFFQILSIMFIVGFIITIVFIFSLLIQRENLEGENQELIKGCGGEWIAKVNCLEWSDNWEINSTDIITFPNYEEYKEFWDNLEKLPDNCEVVN